MNDDGDRNESKQLINHHQSIIQHIGLDSYLRVSFTDTEYTSHSIIICSPSKPRILASKNTLDHLNDNDRFFGIHIFSIRKKKFI